MGRIIIFTGKGGVGKTSVAAAHALKSAKEGQKTLLVSTDMAHNLSDLFGQKLGRLPCEVYSNLDALELDPAFILEEEFQEMKTAFVNLLSSTSIPADGFDQLSVFPGMNELISLLKIMEIYESGVYRRIIVDCAPTGETLSLLKFPEMLSWYMEKFFPLGKAAMRVLSPIAKATLKVELPNGQAMNDIEKIYLKLINLQTLLKDKRISSVRLVCLPEKMVVEETKRNYMYMNLYNFQVDGLYINRILPTCLDNPFFQQWFTIQNTYIGELESVFSAIPISHIPWFDSDLNGLAGVEQLEHALPENKKLFDIAPHLESENYERTDTGYLLKLSIPFGKKEELMLHESGTDLIIKIGGFKRNIPLPNTLRHYEVTAATFEEDILNIHFTKFEKEVENHE